MLQKKLVAAQKRGETRALWLGLGMMACSAMMYLFIGIVLVYLHRRSVWADESECDVVKANIKEDQCSFIEGSEDKYIFHYPCLEVYVNLTHLGQVVMLYHTEQTMERNPKVCMLYIKAVNSAAAQQILTGYMQRRDIINGDTMAILAKLSFLKPEISMKQKCSYIPLVMGNYEQVQQQVEEARDYFRMHQRIPCHYDPSREEKSVLFKRLYPPEGFLIAFACPSMLLIGGILIVILVKLNQYLALVSARQRRTVM